MAGDGPLRTAVEERRSADRAWSAHLLGTMRDPEEVLAAADVLLLTSRSEGVPGVLVEAGLTGLPA